MALLSDRTGHLDRVVATDDENGDGRVDRRDDTLAAERVAVAPPTTSPTGRAQVDERVAAQRRLEDRTAAAQTATMTRPVVTEPTPLTPASPPVGPRARTSMLATAALIVGLIAFLTVFTGVLAGPGVALGLIAAFLGAGGIAATGRRHIAGKGHALLAIALGLGAIVIGTLALTGTLSWLDGSTNEVLRVHDWLAARVSWLFPTR